MDASETHYIQYDPNAIWLDMMNAYVEAGGDILYPGSEKEILLRGVQAILTQALATVDNALRMDTLKYAVGEYLDLYGVKRYCYREAARAATSSVRITFNASGQARVIPAGTAMTADGERIYVLTNDVTQTGYSGTVDAGITAEVAGSAGNGLLTGTQMQMLVQNNAIDSICTIANASGGLDKEQDEAYRSRIQRYGLANITTGPEMQYERAAMDVTSDILDAKAMNTSAGCVGVYLILSETADEDDVIAAVTEALSAYNTRPLSDSVTVSVADELAYTLNVEYSLADGVTEAALQSAVDEYQKWQENTVGRAFNPDRLSAMLYQAGATRVVWGTGSAFNSGSVEYTVIDSAKRCKGTITLAVITT